MSSYDGKGQGRFIKYLTKSQLVMDYWKIKQLLDETIISEFVVTDRR